MTVVDGSSFMDELMAGGALKDRGWQAQPEDQRTIAQLFCDQVGDRVYPSIRHRRDPSLRRSNLPTSLS